MSAEKMTTGLPSSDLFGQLQLLMAAASSEVANIDDMKVKVKEAELFRERVPQLENEVAAAKEMNYGLRRSMGDLERQNAQLRHDMQSLNDIYHTEHREYINMQQARQNSDNEVLRLKHELAFAKSQINNFGELRSSNDSLVSEAVSIRKEMEALKASNTSLLTEKQTLVEVQKREREMLLKQLSNSEEEAQRLRTAAEECVFNEEAMKVSILTFLDITKYFSLPSSRHCHIHFHECSFNNQSFLLLVHRYGYEWLRHSISKDWTDRL